ncbi:hypothetical protein NI389_02835 [Pseudoalteromonas xiamenensis]|uniref:hypothetical protein n=1 Tax=Pseudoalteromonas xiamenensis TaxID=882626 RepID=UPI0027E47335|nr:hypothetical protein [Pseudoalteromonas xiamenensis]WMN60366.1 hypothetical protein NI389_02835 [Pseudoalteromonas xiamenensis]
MKRLSLFTAVCFGLFLTACTQEQVVISKDDLRKEFVSLNQALRSLDSSQLLPAEIPFGENYLKSRHQLLKRGMAQQEDSELNYLMISERFPERYLPWPIQSDLDSTVLSWSESKQNEWFAFVLARLKNAQESKIRLSSLEQRYLVQFLSNWPSVSAEKVELLNYLSDYKPRTRLGMDQLPNGSEWYQSKLNYFGGSVEKPLNWMQLLTIKLGESDEVKAISLDYQNIKTSLAEQFLALRCKPQNGFDWQYHYVHLVNTVTSCSFEMTTVERQYWLTLMLLDVGMHYQGWTTQLAEQYLRSRIDGDDDVIEAILQHVSLYPASVFVFWSSL